MKGKLKQTKGITLIALVITIIVLLILAGVSIAMLTGENGILTQANNATIQQSHGAVREGIALAYNEYQIEINTASNGKLASTKTVQLQGKEEKALASYSSFLDFLSQKGYADSSTGIINVEALTGSRQALGNGTGSSDVYKIEEQDGSYVVNYYDKDGTPEQIWSISDSTSTGDATLEPDTGKEALILVYNVSAGDTIELPYNLTWWEDNVGNDAKFDFTVDWGDGNTDSITNVDIGTKAIHQYTETKEMKITITGTFESISSTNNIYEGRQGYDKLVRVEQWGITGLKTIDLADCTNLTQIAQPTESSFKDLSDVSFSFSGIQSIPDKMFANCTKITSFFSCFQGCTNLTTIGEGIFDGCNSVTDYRRTFRGCDRLTGKAPELWLIGTNSEENGYQGNPDGLNCFAGCEGLDNYEEIPNYWKNFIEPN